MGDDRISDESNSAKKPRLVSPQTKTKVVHVVNRSNEVVRQRPRRAMSPSKPASPPDVRENLIDGPSSSSQGGATFLELSTLGDELLNGSADTSSREVVINGRTYSIQTIAGQSMFVDVLTQQKLLPVQHDGELTLVDVLDEALDDADLKDIDAESCFQPEEFIDLGQNTTHVDVIRALQPQLGENIAQTPAAKVPEMQVAASGRSFVRCEFCSATFSKRSNYYRHLRRAHETDSNQFRQKPSGDKGKCPECDSRFFSRHELLLHLAHNHNHEVVLFNLTFMNKDAYTRWLDDVKVQYTTSYVAHNGGRKSQDGRTGRIYHCSHEFMSYKQRLVEGPDKIELTMRSKRSVANKVHYCTAHLRVFTDEKGILYVTGSPTHINHQIDPDNLSGARVNLPSSETLPGYRSIFKNCDDGLPAQTKATLTSVINKTENLKAFLQHRPVSEHVLLAVQRTLLGISRSVSSYKCRAVVSDAVMEDQSLQAAMRWAKD